MLQISVLESDWGNAILADIQRLLEDVASHFVRELRYPFTGTIRVTNLPTEDSPRGPPGRAAESSRLAGCSIGGQAMSRFAYQFAHECCHVLSGYERLRNNPNNWFHEAICELASMFALRRMGERRRTQPPYADGRCYAESLEAYSGDLVEKYRSISPGGSFNAWLSTNEEDRLGIPAVPGQTGSARARARSPRALETIGIHLKIALGLSNEVGPPNQSVEHGEHVDHPRSVRPRHDSGPAQPVRAPR